MAPHLRQALRDRAAAQRRHELGRSSQQCLRANPEPRAVLGERRRGCVAALQQEHQLACLSDRGHDGQGDPVPDDDAAALSATPTAHGAECQGRLRSAAGEAQL